MFKEILIYRIPTAVFFIGLTILVLWLDLRVLHADILFTVYVMVAGGLATLEFYRMSDGSRRAREIEKGMDHPGAQQGEVDESLYRVRHPMKSIGVASTVVLIAVNWLVLPKEVRGTEWGLVTIPQEYLHSAFVAVFLGILFARARRARKKNTTLHVIADVSLTYTGILIGWFLCSFTLRLRHVGAGGIPIHLPLARERGWGEIGMWVVAATFLTAKCMDIGGLIVGRLIGKHRITPLISPKKTWEGFFGGLALAVVAGWILSKVSGFDFLSTWQVLVFSAVSAVAGFLGDLAGSLMKRSAGVKDTADYIRGWGGVIDLIDSLLVAGPVVMLLLQIFSNWSV